MNTPAERPISILLCALGGEGGGVLSGWLVEAALRAGFAVQSTSIPGVAQRTGATTYYVEVFPTPRSQLAGRKPVFSLYPVPGGLDVLVSSELLETARQIGNGMASADRTLVISSSSRTLTTNERMQLGDGRIADAPLLEVVHRHSREHHVFDMSAATRESATMVSAVMFGALVASEVLPLGRDVCEAVIRAAGRGADASLRGFASAFETVRVARDRAASVQQLVETASSPDAHRHPSALPHPTLPAPLASRFPREVHDLLALGHARIADYQDGHYAALYTERLGRVLEAERAGDPDGANGWSITRESARYLALWMAFDDIVRVADLKIRRARRERVRREVKVGDGEVLRVYDHFKPGVPEFAALLPEAMAGALTRWDARRQARGAPPFALPLKIGSHTISGAIALRMLASLKGLRRRGSRYAVEQALIERWLAAVERAAREHWALGHELAACGRLVKGYGSTNERGKANLLHIVDHLAGAPGLDAPARAQAIRAARDAALADEGGKALDQTLRSHGAPARPVEAVPIRFVRRPASARVKGAAEAASR